MGAEARQLNQVAEGVRRVVWRPQPGPQTALLSCPAFEILFGGARGGGKTDGMLGEWAVHADRYGEHAKGIFFRKTLPQLEAAIARSKVLYRPLGARWLEQKKTWIFPGGAVLKFRYLETADDAENYQGHDYTRLYFEELTNWADPAPIFMVSATLRSGAGVPCRMLATANPGGPGHQWVKGRYIDPAPAGYKPIQDEETGEYRVFIPSKLSDNLALMRNDPGYAKRLRGAGSEQLVKAWLAGDWNIVEGAFFANFSAERHIIPPFTIPKHWTRYRCFDWGSAKPFATLWLAVSDGTTRVRRTDGTSFYPPVGAVVVYREYYGMEKGKPNVGLKMPATKVAEEIKRRDGGDTTFGLADPAIFAEDGGPSIADMMRQGGVVWRPADNSRMAGWEQVRIRLEGEEGLPMLYFFNTCTHIIRTLPALQHDEHNAEDVDSDGEDHAPDALRYGLMARPLVRKAPHSDEPKPGTLDWLLKYTGDKPTVSKYRSRR